MAFVVENHEFHLHKSILSSSSSVLAAMLHKETIEVDRIRKVFSALIRFIYTDKKLDDLSIDGEDEHIIEDLRVAADKYAEVAVSRRFVLN